VPPMSASIPGIWADGGYAGKFVEAARWFCGTGIKVVKKKEGQRQVKVLPHRRIARRTLAWITERHRLDHGYEQRLIETYEAMVKWALVGPVSRATFLICHDSTKLDSQPSDECIRNKADHQRVDQDKRK